MEKINGPLGVPICIFIFLREKQTLELIDTIRKVKPSKLYIVGEGHRPDRIGEKEKVLELRRKVENAIDWPCEVYKNYVPEDIGAGKRIYSGIDWVFAQEEECIFLEDDIRPSVSFFYFCEELLLRYKKDTRIGLITGFNPLGTYCFDGNSYGFSHCGSIYGWASWRDRWKKYDWEMKALDNDTSMLVAQMTAEKPNLAKRRVKKWKKTKLLISNGSISTWDYQWDITRRSNNWLDIVPAVSLTENCGVDEFARSGPVQFKLMPKRIQRIFLVRKQEIEFPLKHPEYFLRSNKYDDKYMGYLLPNRFVTAGDVFIKKIKLLLLR